MTERDEDSGFLTVIVDTNVLLHGKPIVELPWHELERAAIEVLYVPPVIREIDKLKNQSGRSGKIARQLSSDIRTLLESPGHAVQLRAVRPRLSKRLALESVLEPLHPSLKLDHFDQALINYALQVRSTGADVLLMTDDTICGATARELGLATKFLPEHWKRDSEPDEKDKENAALKAQLKQMRPPEPKVELSFQDGDGKLLQQVEACFTSWPALDEDDIKKLMADVQARCPAVGSFDRSPGRAARDNVSTIAQGLAFGATYVPATQAEIERYQTKDHPNWLDTVRKSFHSLHLALALRERLPQVVPVAANTGDRPALEALVRLQARGSIELRNVKDDGKLGAIEGPITEALQLPLPPTPPRGKIRLNELYRGLIPGIGDLARTWAPPDIARIMRPEIRDADAFYWRKGARHWGTLMELECANWRHGQKPFNFRLWVRSDEDTDVAGALELSVHANNISDAAILRLPVRLRAVRGDTFQRAQELVEELVLSARVQELL